MADEQYNQQQKFYDAGYDNLAALKFGFPDLKIVDSSVEVRGKKILNIGGGNSSDTWFLVPKNEVHSLDGSEVAVQQARQHGVQVAVADVNGPLPFTDNDFDVVVLKDILEHIYNPIDLLKEAKRVVKQDGYIIVSVPNHFYLPFRLRIFFGGNLIWKTLLHNHKKIFEEWNYMHIRFFTWKGVKKMIKQAGLKIEKAYWDFGTLAHYSDPTMYERAFKLNNKKIESQRQWLMYKILLPGYKIFNFVFPKWLRAKIVSLAPGLFCAGFYLKIKK